MYLQKCLSAKKHTRLKAAYTLLFFMLILHPLLVFARYHHLRFEQTGLAEGLSQSTVTCMIQDSQGFMWFGTQDGLNRYDGYSIKIYRHDPDNHMSLSDNFINALVQSPDGSIWIGTLGGLTRYDPEHDMFSCVHLPSDDELFADDQCITALFADSGRYVWAGTHHGLVRFNTDSGQCSIFRAESENPSSISNDYIKSICGGKDGVLWIGTKNGLNRFDRKTESFSLPVHSPDWLQKIQTSSIEELYHTENGRIWIGTNHGLAVFDPVSGIYRFYVHEPENTASLASDNIQSFLEDSKGTMWVGTVEGLNKYMRRQDNFVRYQHDPKDPQSLSHNSIQSITEDAGGVLWFGTFAGGVNKCDLATQQFHHFQKKAGDENSLSDNQIYTIFEDSGRNIWIGTLGGGLNRLSHGAGKYIRYQFRPGKAGICSNNLRAIAEDSKGRIWIGAYSGGLDRLDPETGVFTNVPLSGQSKPPSIRSLYRDSRDMLWAGTYRAGIIRIDLHTGEVVHFPADSVKIGITRHFFKDSRGVLWAGGSGGLYQYHEDTDSFIQKKLPKNGSYRHSNVPVNYIMEHTNGSVWIGTFDGLKKLDRKTGAYTNYHRKHGLPNDAVYGIFEDTAGHLWMSTNNGISCFNPETGMFTNYDTEDGLQGSEFNAGAHFQAHDGRLYFGGMNGFNVFHPDSIQLNPYKPPVVITDFLLFNKLVTVQDSTVLSKNITHTKSIVLHHKDYIFSFDFSALSYFRQKQNQYRYKMEGFDREWRTADYMQRRATYTNLPFGDYTFCVQAANADGVWNEKGACVRVTILPPFWKTFWFRALYVGIMFTLAAGVIAYRFYAMKQRNENLAAQVQERTKALEKKSADLEKTVHELQIIHEEKDRFFNIIAHDLRSPFNTIASYVRLVLRNIDNYSKEQIVDLTLSLKESSETSADLLENLLTWSRSQTGKILYRPEKCNLAAMVDQSSAALEKAAEIKQLELKKNISGSLSVSADREMIRTVLRNLISNAIKFTPKGGRITVSAETDNGQVRITVSDTGTGMSEKVIKKLFRIDTKISCQGTEGEPGTGLGLILCNEFLEKHDTRLQVESEEGKGSSFSFTLPSEQ